MYPQQEADPLPLLTVRFRSPRPLSDDVTQVQTPGSEPWTLHQRYQLTRDLTKSDLKQTQDMNLRLSKSECCGKNV